MSSKVQLGSRLVLLKKGKAFISKKYISRFIVSRFEDDLRKGMDYFSSIKHRFQDDRINTVLSQLTNIVRIECRIDYSIYRKRMY